MADKPDISMVDNRSMEDDDRTDKQGTSRVIANIHVLGLTDDDADFYENFPLERRKKLVRKVVSCLRPFSSTTYTSRFSIADVETPLGLAPGSHAGLSLPYFSTRPSQHRKREDRRP